MSTPNVLGYNPIWYIADLTGKPLGGGFLVTQSNLNPEILKPVYTDATNNNPWDYDQVTNQPPGRLGILFGLNGQQGPFYFSFDPANPKDTYFLQVYDSNGVLVWTVNNYFPNSAGGGSIITSVADLENFIVNNVMYRNIGPTPIATTQMMRLAPGAHSAIPPTTMITNVDLGSLPDVYFLKNNLNSTDTIAFPKFDYGDDAFNPDQTPVDYLEYACTIAGTGETYKCVQFPITQGAPNLSDMDVTVAIYARAKVGTSITLSLFFRQFFGDGGSPSPQVLTPIGAPLPLTAGWQRFVVPQPTTIPSVFTKTPGACGNDSLYLIVQFPFDTVCTIDFTKPALYAINADGVVPVVDYHTYDMIDGVINAPRTGYVFSGYDLVAPPGYLMLDDTTIGLTSAATHFGTLYFPLYNWLWTNVSQPSANARCPVVGGLGVSAVADFTANKPLTLPKALGRTLSGSGAPSDGGTAYPIGAFNGEQSHTMTVNELVAHTHDINLYGASSAANTQVSTFDSTPFVRTIQSGSTGLSAPFNVIQPTTYLNYFIKL